MKLKNIEKMHNKTIQLMNDQFQEQLNSIKI